MSVANLIGRVTTLRVKVGRVVFPVGMHFVNPTVAMNAWHAIDKDYSPDFGTACISEGECIGLGLAHTEQAPYAYNVTPEEAVVIAAAHGWVAPLQVPAEVPSPVAPPAAGACVEKPRVRVRTTPKAVGVNGKPSPGRAKVGKRKSSTKAADKIIKAPRKVA